MRSRYWAVLLGAVLIGCAVAGAMLMDDAPAGQVQISSEGRVVEVLDLDVDQEFRVDTGTGYNLITVRDGKVAVTEASCPDKLCMERGFCSSGSQIVCLPNRLVLSFLGDRQIDGAAG